MIKLPKKPPEDKDSALAADYYAADAGYGHEHPSAWGGKGAELLGLTAFPISKMREPKKTAASTPAHKGRSDLLEELRSGV